MNKKEIINELYNRALPGLKKKPEDRTYRERADIWFWESMVEEKKIGDEGEEVDIFDGKALAEGKILNPYDNEQFPEWFKELGKKFGQKVGKYKLIGVSYTFLDLYYILEGADGKRKKVSCVMPLGDKNL